MCKISLVDKISFLLVLVGSINLGFIGLFDIDILSFLTANSSLLQRLVYILIFVSAIDLIVLLYKCNPFKFNN